VMKTSGSSDHSRSNSALPGASNVAVCRLHRLHLDAGKAFFVHCAGFVSR
jgi:hypothetical protein